MLHMEKAEHIIYIDNDIFSWVKGFLTGQCSET